MKRICLTLAILILFTSGCAYIDIDKRSFVLAIGIDKEDPESSTFDIHLKIALPSGEANQEAQAFILETEKADSLAEGIEIIKQKADKELDFSHMKATLFGSNLKPKDVLTSLDWLKRRSDIQNISHIALASPNALVALETKPSDKQYASLALNTTLSQYIVESPFVASNFLFEFNRNRNERGISPSLPVIELDEEEVRIRDAMVLKGKDEWVEIDEEQVKFFNMLAHGLENETLKVADEEQYFFVRFKSFRSDWKLEENASKLHVQVNMKGDIEESSTHINENKLEPYQQQTEEELKKKITSLLTMFREENIDPLGLGLTYRATHFQSRDKEWEDWQKLYPDLEIDVDADVELISPGLIK
ncbi:Ger(x)C family spore germination protein [Halobacillus salinus]|uniref:Ger(x)C family spore germination protein n=1 Tax=Halobacillus salinus TaxID=192814 RepID=UPI0009A89B6D|nr:Ger(x)C family spore germination protein [Halobacillus salinus]